MDCKILLVLVVILAMLAGSSYAAAPAKVTSPAALSKLSPGFVSEIGGRPQNEMVRVIIKYDPDSQGKTLGRLSISSGAKVTGKITSYGGKVKYEYAMSPSISASVPAGAIDAIAADSSVEAVYPVKVYHVDRLQATPLMKADTAASNYLVNGTAINISILDTGISNHTEFMTPNRLVKEKCYCTNESLQGCCPPDSGTTLVTESGNATDDHGHGTHVAGIAAGQGSSGYGYGAATNASLFAVKVCNSAGSCQTDDIIRGIEWAVQNGANVISMSLGGAVSSDCYEDGVGDWIDNLTAQGILFVVAAGNCGPGGDVLNCPVLGSRTIDSPGCAKGALTVGSAAKSDAIASYSSRGPTLDNRTKPDVAATGSSITSTYNNGGYASASGTSMATPFAAGQSALFMQLYRQHHGSLPDPSLVKAVVMTAVNTTGMQADSGAYTQRNNVYGSGRIDFNESLRIANFTANGSVANGQTFVHFINVTGNALRVTLYWPENRSVRNNLNLVVGNGSQNFSWSLDANDTVEQVFIGNTSNGTWRAYVSGVSVAGGQRYFLASSMALINDTTPPFWHGNMTITAGTYNQSNLSYFNVTWNDTGLISSVLIEGNWSGAAANYSMMDYGNGNYSYSAILPDGVFYWRSWANDTAGNMNVTDNWTFTVLNAGPDITGASVFPVSVLPGDNVTVFANASDWSLDGAWFNLYNTSSLGEAVIMRNASSRFNATYNTSNLAVGVYGINVSANDTRGNVTNVSAGILNVTVPRNITLSFLDYESSSAGVAVMVLYNGTSTVRDQSTNATSLALVVPEGLWDVSISSTFNVTLFSVNTSGNATGNVTIDSVPNSYVALSGFAPVQVVAMESGINFSNATILVPNSSIATSLNLSVLACHSWNISSRSCGGAWQNATANSTISAGLASVNTAAFSAFAVLRNTTCGDGFVDSGETTSTCCQDTGCPPGQSCSSSGACYTQPSSGGGGTAGGESFAQPKRKSLLVFATEAVTMLRNSSKGFSFTLSNNGEVNLTGIRISCGSDCGGCALDCYNGSASLGVNDSRDFAAGVKSGNPGRYSILINVSSAQGAGNRSSVALNVLECEPGSSVCSGSELMSCSPDGMALNSAVCAEGCGEGRCLEKKEYGISGNEASGAWILPDGSLLAAATVVLVSVLLVIAFELGRHL